MPSPLGQKQPKVQKLEQVCCGLEQVLMQASPHSWYTWLAGHGPTAAAQTASVTGAGVSQSPRRLPGPGPSPPSCTQSPSISQTRGVGLGHRCLGPWPSLLPFPGGLTAEARAPPAADSLAGHAAATRVLRQRGTAAVLLAWLGALGHVLLAALHERLFGHVALRGHPGQQLGASLGLGRGPRRVMGVSATSHTGLGDPVRPQGPAPTVAEGLPQPRGPHHLTYVLGLWDPGAGDWHVGADLVGVIQRLEGGVRVRFQQFAWGCGGGWSQHHGAGLQGLWAPAPTYLPRSGTRRSACH